MTDSTTSRSQTPALLFIVLLLVIGALIMIVVGASQQSAARPDLQYVDWKSSDGLVELERPSEWEPQDAGPQNPYTYIFVSNPSQEVTTAPLTQVRFAVIPSSGNTAEEVMNQVVAPGQADIQRVDTRAVEASGLKGVASHVIQLIKGDQNKQTRVDAEAWVLEAGQKNYFVAIVRTLDYAKAKPIFEHMMSTLKINVDEINKGIKTIMEATLPPTESATVEAATAQATGQPTVQATESATTAATMEATMVATTAVTTNATEVATTAATATATNAPTATPEATLQATITTPSASQPAVIEF